MRTAEYPDIGYPNSTTDTRGGLGPDGLQKLIKFEQAGGTLVTEKNTSAIFPTYSLTPGLPVTTADGLVNRGMLLRGVIADVTSPVDSLRPGSTASARGGRGFGDGGRSVYQNTTPMATWVEHSQWDPRQQRPASAIGSVPDAASSLWIAIDAVRLLWH